MEDGLKTLSDDAAGAVKPIFTSWNVVVDRQYPKPDDVDALILSGSSTDSHRIMHMRNFFLGPWLTSSG